MTLDLMATLEIVDDDISAVVGAYMANPRCGPVSFGGRYRIDPSKALAEHPFARVLIGQPWACFELRCRAVRAAIMLAEPDPI